MSLPKVIIFDYDGTLADTLDAYYEAGMKFQQEHNIALFTTKEELCALIDEGIQHFITTNKIRLLRSPLLLFRIKKHMRTINLEHVKLYPGVKQMLTSLTLPKYIVTSNLAGPVRRQLISTNTESSFKAILGSDYHTSKVRKIKEICAREQCSPEHIMFVSDTSSDIREAKKAGATTIAVRYGYGNDAHLTKAQPDFNAETTKDIVRIIRQTLLKYKKQ